MAEPGAKQAYNATRLAFELGRSVRQLRENLGWNQTELAKAAAMTRSAVARFEAGGTIPSLPVLERLASALDTDLVVQLNPRARVALSIGLAVAEYLIEVDDELLAAAQRELRTSGVTDTVRAALAQGGANAARARQVQWLRDGGMSAVADADERDKVWRRAERPAHRVY